MEVKRYRLKKDWIAAGGYPSFRLNAKDGVFFYYKAPYYFANKDFTGFYFHSDTIENNPDFFEEIKEDIVKEKPFVWTDELVSEYFKYTMAEYYKGETWTVDNQAELYHIKQFKASKQSREVLFTTEDGVDVFDGDGYFLVSKEGFEILTGVATSSTTYAPNYYAYFKTREAAQQYIDSKQEQIPKPSSSVTTDKKPFENRVGGSEEENNKDWEIVSWSSYKSFVFEKESFGRTWAMGTDKLNIHSVKRLSDNIVFTVGDKVDRGENASIGTIYGFEVLKNWHQGIRVYFDKEKYHGSSLSMLSHIPKEKSPSPSNERVEVFGFCSFVREGSGRDFLFQTNKEVSSEKCDEIKKTIEQILNN